MLWQNQPMVYRENARKDFSERLGQACDSAKVRRRGRAVDIQKMLKGKGITASTTAIGKWLNGDSVPDLHNMLALSECLGVNAAWLEYGEGPKHGFEIQEGGKVVTADFSRKAKPGELSIPQFDVRAAMGSGQLPNDYVEIIRHVTMHKSHLDLLGITYTSAANLAIITGWGQSMAGTINHGEPVFVDRGVTSFIGDGVYVFTWDDLVYIKRVQKISKTHFKVISDNRDHDPFEVPIEEVVFHAQALLAWNARKL